MSRKFKYVGPYDEVEVVRDGVVFGVVKQGHQIEIDDPEASKGLDGSPDWEPVRAPRKRAAAKKAAAKKAAAKKTAAKRATAAKKAAMSVNEVRELEGLPPVEQSTPTEEN